MSERPHIPRHRSSGPPPCGKVCWEWDNFDLRAWSYTSSSLACGHFVGPDGVWKWHQVPETHQGHLVAAPEPPVEEERQAAPAQPRRVPDRGEPVDPWTQRADLW